MKPNMTIRVTWKEKMLFEAKTESDHQILMDAKSPIGTDQAPLPKQLLLSAVAGCTAMDVAALMKKYKQPVVTFEVAAEASESEGSHPIVFKEIFLKYLFTGEIENGKALEAAGLSMTKYCGVSAMVSKAVPIHYTVIVNGVTIGTGDAKFSS